MKKFLIYLVVILVAVSVGFTVFYLVKDDETISITTSSIYMREGDVIDDLGIVYENRKTFSDYEVFSSNDGIATYDKEKGTLTAVSGGIATITFRTDNVKFRNLSCQVYVGDGSITSPYYIQTADDLREIGAKNADGTETQFGLDKCYKLVNNINLADGYSSTGYWVPIGTGSGDGFTGSFDGNGYTISNVNVNKQAFIEAIDQIEGYNEPFAEIRTYTNAGVFGKIGPNGRVVNLKLENINISGDYSNASILGNVGVVAGENYGTIERVEVVSGYVDVVGTNNVGGITGTNVSSEATITIPNESGTGVTHEYVRFTARVDRTIANVQLGISKDYTTGTITGATKNVGGLVGTNHGGTIIYSYSKGEAHLNSEASNYGGIVGYNAYVNFLTKNDSYLYEYSGAHVKDCYTLMKLRKVNAINDGTNIGGVIGFNQDRVALDLDANGIEGVESAGFVNKVIGNYYLTENLNYVEQGSVVNPDEEEIVEQKTYIGCGKYENDNKVQPYPDTQYIIQGKNSNELKMQYTYQSHEEVDKVKNEDTGEYDTITVVVPWKFDSIWYFSENLNDGYPTLSFANLEVSDDIFDISDGTTIDTVKDLAEMKLDGHYIITSDIHFGENDVWTPIGTINKPFIGSLKAGAYIQGGVKQYYKIYDIKTSLSRNLEEIDREELEYAGLFGVTNGSASGFIENITLVNPLFANGKIVGGIVATNGYVTAVKGVATTFTGLTVENCQIVGGTLRATHKVGSIVGDNLGTVKTSAAVDQRDDDYNEVSRVNVMLYGGSEGYAGGIVGYNHNKGVVTGSRFAENSTVVASSGTGMNFNVYVGGIAGVNDGTITNCAVTSNQGVSIQGLKGYAGGIAGSNRSEISNSIVSTAINSPTSNDQTYAGGIAGSVVEKSKITNVLVTETSVKGYYAGGIAGYINYSTPDGYKYNLTVDKNYNYTLTDKDVDTASIIAIDDKTNIEGKYAGGFAAVMDNGIIRNSYTRANLSGIDKNSIKAGFVVDLNLNKNTKDVAIIINCYNTCSFEKGNGKNYSVSSKEILQDPIFDFNVDALKRNAGYCFDYAYINNQDGVTNPTNKDWLVNIFDKDKSGTSIENLMGTSPQHLTDRGFSTDYWKFNDGALPTLKSTDTLKNSLQDIFDRVHTISFPSNVRVTRNGIEIASGSKVTKGDVLVITCETTEKYSVDVFTVNGLAIESGAKFTVGDENVNIVYTEKLTHYDVEIVGSENGTVSVGAGYIKENEEVTIQITPNPNFVVDTVKVIKENGEEVEVLEGYKFIMPSCKVKIEVTFKQTYALNIPENVTISKNDTPLNSGERVVAGDELTINVTPPQDHILSSLEVKTLSGQTVELLEGNKFVMPSEDVQILVTFKRYGTIAKASNIKAFVNNVEVTEDQKVLEGDTVKLEITPETNYVVDLISVSTTSGQSVTVTNNEFVMPNEDVTINVTYKQTYALTIPKNVTIKLGDKTLTSEDRVVEGNVLTITFTASDGYTVTSVTVNGYPIENGGTFTVGKEDVVIVLNEEELPTEPELTE